MNALRTWLAAIALAVPLAVGANPKDDEWLKGRLFPPDVVLKHQAALKLTDAQRQAIRREIAAVQGKVATVDFDIMDAAVAFQSALDAPTLDRAQVLAQADKVFEADARKKRAWIEMLLNIRAVLNAEQVAYLRRVTADGGER